jgi:hypothetical protein
MNNNNKILITVDCLIKTDEFKNGIRDIDMSQFSPENFEKRQLVSF